MSLFALVAYVLRLALFSFNVLLFDFTDYILYITL